MDVRALVTVPPYATFAEEVAAHPMVAGLRLNTVMPIKEPHRDVLSRLAALGQPVWVDLKARQLRVVGAAVPPYTEVRVSHPVEVTTPVDAYFSDGREVGRVVAIDGHRLILEDGPRRLIGPGESVNIPGARVLGGLTPGDRLWLEAMRSLGMKKVMLSFVEDPDDVEQVRELLPRADLVLKIESSPGIDFCRRHRSTLGRLMAARGDLYVEVGQPWRLVAALREVIEADPEAFVASRLFGSLATGGWPAASDITDCAYLLSLGYRTFMLGDEVCLARDSVLSALELLQRIAEEMTSCVSV